MRKQYGRFYKRRSAVYPKLRSKKLAVGEYLVEHMASKLEFYVFKRRLEEDWAITTRQHSSCILASLRKKDKIMELLAKEGPRLLLAG